MSMVNVHDARTHLSQPLERALAGEEIVLAKAGRPCARLVPLAPVRAPGGLPGHVDDSFFEELPDDEIATWDGST